MNKIILHFIAVCGASIFALQSPAQNLNAKVLLQNQLVLDGSLSPRKLGTTQVQFSPQDAQNLRNLSISDIEKIHFDLRDFEPNTLKRLFDAGNYSLVIDALKGRIIPYFSFVDLDANSNLLIEYFIVGLYRTQNYAGVHAAAKEVAKYAISGDVRKMADVYRGLSYLEQGDLEAFSEFETYFTNVKRDDHLAPALWMGLAKKVKLEERPDLAYLPLSKIILERPMQTQWSAEALYLTAVYHHTRTNLVVANQICQEIQIVAPNTKWPELAQKLEESIKIQAEELEITLVDFGKFRRSEDEVDDSGLNYRERQRALEELEIEFE